MRAISKRIRSVCTLAVCLVTGTVFAQADAETREVSAEKSYVVKTATDEKIPVDQLELMAKPLEKDELELEAQAWFALVKAKALELSAAQLGVKKTNTAIEVADEDAEEAAQAIEEAEDVAEANQQGSGEEPNDDDNADANKDDESAAVVEKAEQQKEEILEDINIIRAEQTALVDRLNVVLDAFEAKGGETKAYRDYVDVVTGIDVDVTDTTATWATISGWLVSDEGGWRWGRNILMFLAVIFVSWIASMLAGGIVRRLTSRTKNVSEMAGAFVVSFVRKAILLVGTILALSMLEIDIAPLLAALGAIGFIVGFALQGTLSNFASGLMILVYRPFDTGDLVEAGGTTGRIRDMNLVSTTFQTLDNQRIIVPNNSIWGNVIRNITANSTRRIDMMFGIGYQDDISAAETILCRILEDHPLVLNDPAPIVRVHELADSSVNFVCRPWVNTINYWPVYWDVTRSVKEMFDEHGISIPFPQQELHIHQS